MQAASPAGPERRLQWRARFLVQGIDAAPAAEQTATGFDAGRDAPRVQADRQSAMIVDADHEFRRVPGAHVGAGFKPALAQQTRTTKLYTDQECMLGGFETRPYGPHPCPT